jgi:hypothetical protein
MPWNYRVIRSGDIYSIREVYYKDEGLFVVEGYSAEPSFPHGESLEELIDDLSRFMAASKEPVLSEDTEGNLRPLGVIPGVLNDEDGDSQ